MAPDDSDAWLWHQAHVDAMCEGLDRPTQPVVAAIQLWSDKARLTNKANISAHPIRAALLNVAYSERIGNLDLVGYFPTMQRPDNVTDHQWRLLKLHTISKCLDKLLEHIKLASYYGA